MAKFDPEHATVPATNFADRNSAERFLECGKFRRCANLLLPLIHQSSPPVNVYVPICAESRFNKAGVAQHLLMPNPGSHTVSPIVYTTVGQWAPFISCPRKCKGYRNKTVAALLDKVLSVFGAKLHKMPTDSPAMPSSVLKQAINAVPAVKYALGVGGIISVIAIVRGFGIDYRVAFLGAVVMLVLMTVLLLFAKASARPQSTFKVPAIILTWFCLVLFMATALVLFSSVFFGKPLDLRTLLVPVHAEQTPGRDLQASTTNASGSIVNNGGVINNPTINNNALPPQKGIYELTDERRNRFLKLLSAQTAPRDTVRIGCTSWSETSCVAAGRFLLIFSEAGWQIEQNKVFRLEPQIPIVGVAIVTRTPAGEPKEPLPPHQGRWRLMEESHKTIYWAFNSIGIPAGGGTDDTLKEGTLGIYFGSEPR